MRWHEIVEDSKTASEDRNDISSRLQWEMSYRRRSENCYEKEGGEKELFAIVGDGRRRGSERDGDGGGQGASGGSSSSGSGRQN